MKTVIRALCVLGLLVLASLGLMCTPADQTKSKTVEDVIKVCSEAPAFLICQAERVASCKASNCSDEEQTQRSAACWTACFDAYKAAQGGGPNG